MAHAIETILLEERRYPPPPEFAEQANAQPEIYERDFDEFWGTEARERVSWFEDFTQLYEWEPPYAKWYLGGKLNVAYNCVDRHVEAGRGDKVAYHWEGEPEDERRTITYADLQGEVVKLANALKQLGVGKGTPVGIYLGHGPRGAGRDARLRAARRAAHGRLRRLLGRRARRPPERHGLRGADHAGRGPAQRRCGAAQAQCRRGALTRAGRRARRRPAAHRRRRRLERRARPLVARARRRGARRPRVVPVRADGLGGPALPALHERHDRQAEGDRPHHCRLPRRHRLDPLLHLRRQARLGLLVRGRHRLGHRPQLHRLRAALQRHHERALRGRPELPGQGPLVGDRRAVPGGHPLHGADGDPDAHEVGARVRRRSTTSPRCGCSARSASRSTPRPGSGTASTSAATARRSSTRGGRPRPG